MRDIKRWAAWFLAMLMAAPAIAQGFPECQHLNRTTKEGILDRKECELTVKYQRDRAAQALEAQARQEAFNRRMEQERAAKEAEDARNAEKAKAEDAAYVARAKQQAAAYEAELKRRDAESEAEDRAMRAEERRISKVTAQRKVACGDDYLNPQIGMTISRAKQCVGNFAVVSQTNRADGVVTTYRGTRTVLHVMEGRIVAWSRF
jgi:hypothetical protein